MNKKELDRFEQIVLKAVHERRGLGGYDVNAEAIRTCMEWIALIVQHLNKKPLKKKTKKVSK